ncbi:protein ACCELERATED CELL DEATH 6-like isoform X1 [Prosopis cineraria]|uniref:protein ACCELERATED CELL DEATH 6-like isoform X1 n=1 Tax=Prosopis cineraria TaxID=364024 RepID=UPI00240F76AC|nr:protein ACCELERATED CELL DEATH 6-like isoform X1 [Prosopis cineraria]XP_054802308.1 protein ACCELERATED CELL DEATH 6-like isoform X1 [Prosopis cineraria]XP_054802309.1 protein ACCELERATED CELL DEATH 6-like isoform X1 [Prosopis cineraria]
MSAGDAEAEQRPSSTSQPHQMESQQTYHYVSSCWILPEKETRKESKLQLQMVFEIRGSSAVDGNESNIDEPPEKIFSMPSDGTSTTSVEIERRVYTQIQQDGASRREFLITQFEVVYRDKSNNENQNTYSSWESYNSGPTITKQEHGPTKDMNLLTAAYLSMNGDNVVSCNRDFIVPDWVERGLPQNAIYTQRTPRGNTVLHLAASYGNNTMVEKVAQHAPSLFTETNNNFDTPLHVAARAGHASTIQSLLKAFLPFAHQQTSGRDDQDNLVMMLLISLTVLQNDQGNTFLHEAFTINGDNGAMIFQAFQDPFITGENSEVEANFKTFVNSMAPLVVNREGKSLLFLAIEAGCNHVVTRLMDMCMHLELPPRGRSPLLPAIINEDRVILEDILSKKPDWIHLRNEKGRYPLHEAAFIGYLKGVSYLIKKCVSCTMEMDNDGFFPIHLACKGGHVKVVQELLKWCPDPIEMVDRKAHTFLHIAIKSGRYEVVRYILQHPKLEKLMNQKDNNGNTPLHMATLHWNPIIVHAFTWDKRIDLALLNKQNQTALDIADQWLDDNTSLAQRLTWIALQSSGRPQNLMMRLTPKRTQTEVKKKEPKTERYKDRIDTLIVVSTLIITASFAAGLTMPGDVDDGTAINLNRHVFHLYILCLSISIYGAINSTIILIWARLGDLRLILFALNCVVPLLGISLMTLSLAFLAGVYLVVSKLTWLTITFVTTSVILVVTIVLLYTLLCLPSSSTLPFMRYISYYPFLLLAKLAEPQIDDGANHKASQFVHNTLYTLNDYKIPKVVN